MWGDGEVAVATSVLLERLRTLEEAPWSDWHGRPIDSRFLAQKLKPYGITSTQVKVAGKNCKGYRWEHLAPAWLPVESGDNGSSPVAVRYPSKSPYDTTEVAQVAQVAREAVSDPEATSQTQRVFRTRSGCTQEDSKELWAATCLDLGYPNGEALSVDQLAEIRQALDIDQA